MFHGRKPVREAYDDHFMGNPGNGREVTFHRVVNVVQKRNPMSLMGDRRGLDVPMYNEPMPYHNARDFQGNNNFTRNDMQFFENEDHRFEHFHRNPPPPRNDGPSHFIHNRDDLRHHLESRNNGRGGNFFRNRGRDPVREDIDLRRREPYAFGRDRSPYRRSHSSSSGPRSAEKSISSQQKPKPAASVSPPPPESPKEEPPNTATTSKESPPASVVEPEEEEEAAEEEGEAASVETEPTPELDLKVRRLEAIKAKALEIEKDYRQDCETFRTVVKMLVEKEPSLDYLLQAPLEKSLEEIKGRCLDSLKEFIKELDKAIEQPSSTDQPVEGET